MDFPPFHWEFPAEEQKKVDEFRERVKDLTDVAPYWKENVQLHRFLVARNWDMKKAEKMYRASMKWRKEWRVDYMLKEYKEPEAIAKFFPRGFFGHDKQGYPILVERAGQM